MYSTKGGLGRHGCLPLATWAGWSADQVGRYPQTLKYRSNDSPHVQGKCV